MYDVLQQVLGIAIGLTVSMTICAVITVVAYLAAPTLWAIAEFLDRVFGPPHE